MTRYARKAAQSCSGGGMASSAGFSNYAVILSASCGLADLVADAPARCRGGGVLELGSGWAARWTAAWKVSGAEVVCPARDLGSFPVPGCEPVRRFSWARGQRHRPGLQFMVSTGLHHGFESLEEARLLLAVDFAEAVTQVICQPFRLRFTTVDGPAEHIPDVLAVASGGVWLIDVRPAGRIGEADRVKFAASAEAALACGWRYLLVAGWRPHVMATLDTLSSQRRRLADPLGLQEVLLGEVSRGPRSFGDLVAGTIAPPVARAQLLHLLWHRRLSIDLARPLADATLVHPADRRPG
jgi:hypothetical protein